MAAGAARCSAAAASASAFRGAGPSCSRPPQAAHVRAPRLASLRRLALTRRPGGSVDLTEEQSWERAVAAASAVATPVYAGSFRDDFKKLAGVLDFATAVRS